MSSLGAPDEVLHVFDFIYRTDVCVHNNADARGCSFFELGLPVISAVTVNL